MRGIEENCNCQDCDYTCLKDVSSKEDLELINLNQCELQYQVGEHIIKQGEFVTQVLYLKKGLVKIVLEAKNRKSSILKIIENKNFIVLPLMGNFQRYPFSVVAISACNVCVIKKDTMLGIMNTNIKMNQFVLDWFSEDYLFLYNKITVQNTRNSHGKVATTLLYLTSEDFTDNLITLINRKEIAELSSVSIDSCNKILSDLKNDKIIEIGLNGIRIIRRDLIEKLSLIG